jgi:hypothetical protein
MRPPKGRGPPLIIRTLLVRGGAGSAALTPPAVHPANSIAFRY